MSNLLSISDDTRTLMVVITIAVMSVFFYALLMTVDLPDSSTVLDFIDALVWPVLIAAVLLGYYKPLSAMLRATRFSKVTLRLFGVEIEVPIDRLERVTLMMFPDGRMTREQYDWLADMRERGGIIDAPAKLKTDSEERKLWRPLRNSGLIETLPKTAEGGNPHLGQAETLALTPLGRLLVDAAIHPPPPSPA